MGAGKGRGMGQVIFITGGVRSGKSRFAQELASRGGLPVLYLATAAPGDPEMEGRIEAHRASRPKDWATVEEERDVLGVMEALKGPHTVLLDCVTLWISNLMGDGLSDEEILARVKSLADFFPGCPHRVILVSNEVGWGVVPPYPLGRRFRDLQGAVNQVLASAADEVYLLVAGIPLRIKP